MPLGHRERTLPEIGDDRYLEVGNAAFEGVPGAFPLTREDFAKVRSEPGFVEDLIRVVEDGEGPVGFLRGALAPGHAGEVEAIGLLPRARGLKWQWLLERPDSPWYPSLALLRQRAEGDWSDPIARAAKRVAERRANP